MGWFKKLAKGVWKIADPLMPDEYIGAAGSALHGDWGEAWDKTKTGLKDAVRGAAVGLGGAGLMGVGPLAALGGTGSAIAGGASKVAGGVGSALKGAGSAVAAPFSVGSGLTGYDKAGLILGGLGTAAGAYGAYQEGKGADADRALAARQWDQEFGRNTGLDVEDKRRWDTNFGEDTRRYGMDFGENQRQFDVTSGENTRQFDVTTGEGVRRFDLTRGDERSDVEYGRDLMNKKGRAVSPFVGRLLKLGAA